MPCRNGRTGGWADGRASSPAARREGGVAESGCRRPRGRCFCTFRCLLESQRARADAVTVQKSPCVYCHPPSSRTGTDQQHLGKTARTFTWSDFKPVNRERIFLKALSPRFKKRKRNLKKTNNSPLSSPPPHPSPPQQLESSMF